jgi:hypothetical protein
MTDPVTRTEGRPPDDPSSAPESGTVRDDTSGSPPADRADKPGVSHDDPSMAPEEA